MTEDELDELVPDLDVYCRALCRRATTEEMDQVRHYLLAEENFVAQEPTIPSLSELMIASETYTLDPSSNFLPSLGPSNRTKPSGSYGNAFGEFGAISGAVLAVTAVTSLVAAPVVLPLVAGAAACGWLAGKILGSRIKK